MKNILKLSALLLLTGFIYTSCEKEYLPQNGYATKDQVADAPGAFDNAVSAVTSTLTGEFIYGGSNNYPYDLGWPALNLERDIMGQDIVYVYQNWYSYWYEMIYLGPAYRISQMPWTYYYKWIKSCNDVISLACDAEGNVTDPEKAAGAGIAFAVRAWLYTEMSQMYSQKTYVVDKQDVSVPIVTESTSLSDLAHNPRATHEAMYAFIISDLDKAETCLANYKRPNIYVPDLSVVYGLKARAYLLMGEWANAATYAKKAQEGYSIMSEAQYTDWETGFNTPNSAWMFALEQKTSDPQIQSNDADSSWGSMMYMEINPEVSGCGYAANYGQPFKIDYHLFESIPATDCRKKCYVDFAIDALDGDAKTEALAAYTKHPTWLQTSADAISGFGNGLVGGIELKFRTAGGEAGRDNQYIGFVGSIPLMRVEEMYLIEAEAVGRQNEAEGIAKLTAFAKTRDANYVYGEHSENYGDVKSSAFVNEVWWQRRIELWGEGFATMDIKRLQKGVIRNYPNTNHVPNYRYVERNTPNWMNLCIVQTETNYNYDCTNNPDPSKSSPADDPMVTSFD